MTMRSPTLYRTLPCRAKGRCGRERRHYVTAVGRSQSGVNSQPQAVTSTTISAGVLCNVDSMLNTACGTKPRTDAGARVPAVQDVVMVAGAVDPIPHESTRETEQVLAISMAGSTPALVRRSPHIRNRAVASHRGPMRCARQKGIGVHAYVGQFHPSRPRHTLPTR